MKKKRHFICFKKDKTYWEKSIERIKKRTSTINPILITMSRTYRKNIRLPIACGSNTIFYKDRRRFVRRKNKRSLKELFFTKTLQEIADTIFTFKLPQKDTWEEPTDGSILVNKQTLKNEKHFFNWNLVYDKCKKYLKPKH